MLTCGGQWSASVGLFSNGTLPNRYRGDEVGHACRATRSRSRSRSAAYTCAYTYCECTCGGRVARRSRITGGRCECRVQLAADASAEDWAADASAADWAADASAASEAALGAAKRVISMPVQAMVALQVAFKPLCCRWTGGEHGRHRRGDTARSVAKRVAERAP